MNSTITTSLDDMTSLSTAAVPTRNEALARVEMGILIAIFVITLLGNTMVATAIMHLSRRKKLSRMNRMIGHLTVADAFVALFNVLPLLAWKMTFRFYGGWLLCKLVTYGQIVAMYASSYVLLATAFDRYLAICHPMRTHAWTAHKTHLLAALAWLAASLLALPQLYFFDYRITPYFNDYDCVAVFQPSWLLQLYVTWGTLSIYALPILTLLLVYWRICVAVWSSSSFSQHYQASSFDQNINQTRVQEETSESSGLEAKKGKTVVLHRSSKDCMSRTKKKTVRLTLVVVANYVICYGPFFVVQLWTAWDQSANIEDQATVIILLLASLNSCTNPWICLAFNKLLLKSSICCRSQFLRQARWRSKINTSFSSANMSSSKVSTKFTFKSESSVSSRSRKLK